MGHPLVLIASPKATIETKLIPNLSRKVSHSLGMLRPVQSVRFVPPSERTKSCVMPEACQMSLLMLLSGLESEESCRQGQSAQLRDGCGQQNGG